MIELYVLITLGIFGYMLNTRGTNTRGTDTRTRGVDHWESPSMQNIYNSSYASAAENKTQQRAAAKFQQSLQPMKTGVISKNYYHEKEDIQEEKRKHMIKSLTGELINDNEFTHNNMTPYYGGSIKQNMDNKSNKTLLENFTGVIDTPRNKQEIQSFFDNTKDITCVNGMKGQEDFYKERMVAPVIRNNEFPIPKVQVGPGLGAGYTSNPTGGYQQFETRDYIKQKTVDDLRTQLNPNKNATGATDRSKTTYESRTVDGMKAKMRQHDPNLVKNRVETWYEQTPDMLFKTTGACIKEGKQGEFNVKGTNRLTTSREEYGTAFAGSRLKRSREPAVKSTMRQQFSEFGLGTAAPKNTGIGSKDDYGKSKILVYNNERDVTSTKVYQGNVTSLIKAVIAPLEDMIKITKKQHTVNNPRHFGNLNIQIPNKPTTYDPNDVTRTTVKETLIHDADLGNLRGVEKMTVYDPNDVTKTTVKETLIHDADLGNIRGVEKMTVYDPNDATRTTLKETLIHDADLGNLRGAEKITIYDPNDVTRTTIKETLLHDADLGNLRGVEKTTIYDPNDVARTTIKETLIHDEIGTSIVTGPKQIYVYDPDVVAKKTVRETLDRASYEMNLTGHMYKSTVYDPNDVARATTKETMVDLERLYGNIETREGGGGYETNEYEAKITQKELFSDLDYFGTARKEKGEGYLTNEHEAKNTQKQFLSDIEYFGGADSSDKKQKSYEDVYNALIRDDKEVTLIGREPTKSGKKEFNDYVNMAQPKKNEFDLQNYENIERVYNQSPMFDISTSSRNKNNCDIEKNNRFDVSLLNAFKDNPYTQPLDSVA